jgi:hypothetical protein
LCKTNQQGGFLVGRTVESYRMALEDEIRQWNGFERVLRSTDHAAFEILMDACRSFASAGSNATRPILFEPMVMSIVLSQQKQLLLQQEKIQKMGTELDALKQRLTQT